MAKCGCAASTVCPCVLTAGSNITISGTGQAGDPWVVNAATNPVTVTDTPTVDLTLVGQNISAAVNLEPTGNLITTTAQGLLVSCASVRTCFASGSGINPTLFAAGTVAACLSTDANNALVFGSDGCLYAPVVAPGMGSVSPLDTNSVNMTVTGGPAFVVSADVIRDPAAGNILTIGPMGVLVDLTTGCGLSGEGTAASPLVVHTSGSSPYSTGCGGKVYCEVSSGKLVVDPPYFTRVFSLIQPITGGSGAAVEIDTLATVGGGPTVSSVNGTFVATNPSACRPMQLAIEFGIHHMNMRVDNRTTPGRSQALVGARISAAGSIVFAPQVVNAHNQVLIDSHDYMDYTFDSPAMNLLPLGIAAGAQNDPNPNLIIPPGGSVTFTIEGIVTLTNYQGDTQLGYDVFARAIGWSL